MKPEDIITQAMMGLQTSNENMALKQQNADLKAEVERLQNNCDYLDRELDREIEKTAMLCGQVERLRKAGDAMAVMVGHIEVTGDAHRMMLELSKEWNAAKEGKSV